jgi:hypothetical protein
MKWWKLALGLAALGGAAMLIAARPGMTRMQRSHRR